MAMNDPAKAQLESLARAGIEALRRGDAASARRAFDTVTASGLAGPQVWLMLAQSCDTLDDRPAARAALDKVLEGDPGNPYALVMHGEIHTRDGDDRAAVAWYERALGSANGRTGLPADLIARLHRADAERSAATQRFQTQPAYTPVRHGYEFFDTHLASVIAEIAGLQGPGLSIGGASASGNAAVAIAADLIAIGRMPACLVVGPLPDLSPVEWQSLDAMGALLPADADACRPLDARAQGFAPAEACAAILLESLDHARARNTPVLAQIAASAIIMEPRHGTAPNAEAEYRAMTQTLHHAKIPPAALGYISAHATGAPAGDAAECAAIARLETKAAINATKSITGHALQAASLLELIALVLQLQGGFLHGTANLEHPIAPGLLGPHAIERDVEWALNNAFGFGGINTALLIRNGGAL